MNDSQLADLNDEGQKCPSYLYNGAVDMLANLRSWFNKEQERVEKEMNESFRSESVGEFAL